MTDSSNRHHDSPQDADADAEMVLQNVLSGLLSSSLSEREEDKSRKTMSSLLWRERTVVEWNGIVEWIWTSITMTDNNNNNNNNNDNSTNNNNHKPIDQYWSDAMETIRRDCLFCSNSNIDPFELHATASQFIIFSKEEEEYMIDNDKEKQITLQTTTTTTTLSYFRILCLLLCIIALQRCPSPVTRRYKRWQSILCETIRFFQEMILELDNNNNNNNNNTYNDNNNDNNITWMVQLWVQYQCPAALHVVQQLAKDDPTTTTTAATTSSTNDIQFTAIFAGLVGTTTQLAERIQFQHYYNQNNNTHHHHHHHDDNTDRLSTDMSRGDDTSTRLQLLLQQLLGSLRSICDIFDNNNTILSIMKTNTTSSYDEMSIWNNPWRFYSYNQQQHQKQQKQQRQQSFGDESMSEKLLSNGGDNGDDTIIIGDTTIQRSLSWWIYEASSEVTVASMDTSWSHIGISYLAMTVFPQRPQVYHPQFVWKVWLPHVTQIIKDDIQPTPFQLQQQQPSIIFLQSLLQCTPIRSMTIRTVLDWNNNNDTSSSFLHERPDVPLELVQVLSDRMVVFSPQRPGTDSEALVLQRRQYYNYVSEVASLLSKILDRYEPTDQVQLVATKLIHDCPNPGLQARFIDLLLRPLLSEPTCHTQLWTFLHGQLDKLFRHLDSTTTTTHSSSSSSSSIQHVRLITNVPELIDTVEVHVSTLSLIQRWFLMTNTPSNNNNNNNNKNHQDNMRDVSKQQLVEFHHVLSQQLDHWNKNYTTNITTTTTTKNDDDDDDVPDNFYRLNLLETMLQTVIPLVSG
ncbi:hypothetical protein IV203_014379 [Nitzschia inconspicua]|uniref:Uncharacterized protein n=1 Tax=Nitzschia inconspicua TaxID=303405 RepID=A0A9K3PSB1_9STRA|nr:hypothetical protein IV203_014379 [Nitzschia inconspicua]